MEPVRLGRYLVKRSLASGGMGEVLIALDEQLQREVAIKLMHSEEGASHRLARFEREARIIARLQHPNIVQVYDYGVENDDTPYIVMELLDGDDLSRVFERTGPMPVPAVVPLVAQAARGLHVAHRVGVIHRDLKPANLFLSRQGEQQILKILDFGIATAQQSNPVSTGGKSKLVGTPSYMSPEQVRNQPIDQRTDLWSLAVVAYQALTGVSPFVGRNMVHTIMRVVNDSLQPPSEIISTLGPEVDAFFERALAKDATQRFSSAMEFAAAFSALEKSAEQRPATILVVDDEPDVEVLMRQRFRRLIRRGRYELLFAGDGQAALDVLALRPDIDVVLTDLNMPGMNGLTLLERLGRAGPALRAVVLSAYGDMKNIRAAMNAGAYDFLTKPLDFQDLQATLEKAVRDARELQRALRSIEENDALRMVVDDAVLERLLPLLRVSGDVSGQTIEGTIVSVDVCDTRQAIEDGPATGVFERINRTFDRVVPILQSWEGSVVSFVGDAVLALFQGDDHLLRASGACLAIRSGLGAASGSESSGALSGVCMGLDSGLIVSGNIGSRRIQRLNYTVLGGVVSRAQALERRAEEGQILARKAVSELLEGHFECRPVEGPVDDELGAIYELSERSADAHAPSDVSIRALAETAMLEGPE